MKTAALNLSLLTALALCLSLQAQSTGVPEPKSLVITKVDEILKRVPAGVAPKRGTGWTQAQTEVANRALAQALAGQPPTLKMRLEIADIFREGEFMTLFSSLPNREGYKIRVFAKFDAVWHDRLATLKKGDKVTVTGALVSAVYKTQWNEFALVIGVQTSSFAK